MPNREDRRAIYQKMRKMTYKQFWESLDVLHARAYALAQRHFGEAMDIALQPKQKAAVVKKADEIRELWDGIREVDTTKTVAEVFKSAGGDAK